MNSTAGYARSAIRGEFLSSGNGPVFVVVHQPPGPIRDCVLAIPPFAEEMNKSRRLVTELGYKLAQYGVAVAIPDLFGTGDSAGDFEDATWAAWLEDLARTRDWIESEGLRVSGLLTIRLGAALACDALRTGKLNPVRSTVLCQPVLDGRRHLQQFLRLRVAAGRMIGSSGETIEALRHMLASGTAVEVAGYSLSSTLARDLESVVSPQQLPDGLGEVDWIEIVRSPDASVSAQVQQLAERSAAAGMRVRTHTVVSDPFWGTAEVVVDSQLISTLCNCLGGHGIAVGPQG